MEVIRKSPFTGKIHTRNLPITDTQMNLYKQGYLNLQQAFPHLSTADREFIKTGITEEEWDSTFIQEL